MGCVYLAHDPQIDRKVAIKTIASMEALPAHEREETRRRFVREAQAAGRLQHPGIVTIYDVGEQNGVGFIAMEYIEGETFEDHAARLGLLPMEEALALVAQACDALDYAHREKVIHRDIKPANLMLLADGKVKITDFGLAKNPRTNMTQEGILVGTPNYMSPEQIAGAALDGRADLFSLAAVLYELLTGEKPFAGETITTIIYRIMHEAPAEPRSIKAGLPSNVGRAVMRGLEKDPARRFQTGAEMARALRNWQVQTAVMGSAAAVALPSPAMSGMISVPIPGDERMRSGIRSGVRMPTGSGARAATGSGGRAVAASGARESAQPVAHRSSLMLRGGFILSGVLAIVLLLPAATTLDDRWGIGRAAQSGLASTGAQPAQAPSLPDVTLPGQAGPGQAGPGPAGPELTAPGQTAPGQTAMMATLPVTTDPPGAKLYLDDVEVPDSTVRLPRADGARHTLVAESDCLIQTLVIAPEQVAAGSPIHVKLSTQKVTPVMVTSVPPGAGILLDGQRTGKSTPHELQVAACGEHRVGLVLKGFTDATVPLTQPYGPVNITMVRPPEGFLKVNADYPVGIFRDGTRLGSNGEPIKMKAGRHSLTVRNDDLFVEQKVTIDIGAERTTTPRLRLPELGRLTVLASPSNCTIFVNGRDMGPPPIIDYQLAEGTYSVRAVFVPTGEAKESSVVVAAGAAARVPFKFTP